MASATALSRMKARGLPPPGLIDRAETISRESVVQEIYCDGTTLLVEANKQRACQSAIFIGERRIAGIAFFPEYGDLARKGVFFN